jgi:hypothetical protein
VFAQGPSAGIGTRIRQVLLVLLLTVLIGGAVLLGFWDIEPPSQAVEKVIPDDRFPR